MAVVLLCGLALSGPSAVHAQTPVPTFTKTFTPDTIGPGSTTALVFVITNNTGSPVSNLAFVDNLPAGVFVASPSSATNSCGGSVDAAGSSITFSADRLGAGVICTISVNVTSSTVGTHTNTTGDLTSSAGNSGTATDDLIVAADRPGFSKSFSPSSIPPGGTSRLTFTIDNTANAGSVNSLQFADQLPVGMLVASPANAITNCPSSTVTATSGSSLISFIGNGILSAGASCTVRVDVRTSGAGTFVNTSFELTSQPGTQSSGFATAQLNVQLQALTKAFTNDPVAPGDNVTLQFTITNLDRRSTATNFSFTDDLDAVLSGLVASSLPAAGFCGPGSSLTGSGVLTMSGGELAPGASCTFSATLTVPAGASSGTFTNTTTAITYDLDGSPTTGNAASDDLVVETIPLFTKTFTDDPVGAGGFVTLEFTITNTNPTAPLSDIAFSDNLDALFPSLTATALPSNGFCGAGSSMTVITFPTSLVMTGGDLPGGGSCTFSVTLQLPQNAPVGTYLNVTSGLTGLLNGEEPVEGAPATDNLEVVTAPRLRKSFTDDPVLPGDPVTLEFTITYDENATSDATDIAFTDDLEATLTGLVASTPLPIADVCGLGSALGGTPDNLSLTGGTLSPGGSCTFSLTLDVPATALPGSYDNKTSDLTATVSGVTVSNLPGMDVLDVASVLFTKSFTDDPVFAGDPVTLEFTITNVSTLYAVSNISFNDNLNTVLSGLVVTDALPIPDVCGAGSSLIGSPSNPTLTGGSLATAGMMGDACTFSVTLSVPGGAAPDAYPNTTSNLVATVNATQVILPPATDLLNVADPTASITLEKTFTDDPVLPGGTVTLEFTATYAGPVDATDITFTDDLNAVVPGLVATGLPQNDVCGTGSQIDGTGLLTLTGGTLADGGVCTFSVTLQVPAGATAGTYTNTTSTITATVGTGTATGDAATDELVVGPAGQNRPPVADAGEDQTVECAAPGGTDVTLDGSGSTDPNDDKLTYTWTENGAVIATGPMPTVTLPLGEHTIVLTVDDGRGGTDADGVLILIEDTTGPVITLFGDNPLTLECAFDEYIEPGAEAVDACQGPVDVTISGTVDPATPGTYPITYTASDSLWNATTEVRTVEVVDTTPPVITLDETIILDESIIIWPPNHTYFDVALEDIIVAEETGDACDLTVMADDVVTGSASSDELEDDPGTGDGSTLNDIVISQPDCRTVSVRQERQGGGNGRVYTLNLEVADASGNVGEASFTVAVPHDRNGTAVDDGPLYIVSGCSALIVEDSPNPDEKPEKPQWSPEGKEPKQAKDVLARQAEDALQAGALAAVEEVPETFVLEANYPNPFNPATTLRYGLPESAPVTLVVYDAMGREVRRLVDGVKSAGMHTVTFNARRLPSGLYVYQLVTPAGRFTQTMVLLK